MEIESKAVRAKQRAKPCRISLTEQRVLDLRGEGFAFDTKVSGLAVRTTATGAKSYVFQRKFNGRPMRLAIGKCAGLRLEAARAAVEHLNGQIALGIDPRVQRKASQSSQSRTTLSKAYEQFRSSKARRKSTLRDYDALWRLHVPDRLKRKPVDEITSADAEDLKREIVSKGRRRSENGSGCGGKERTAAKVLVLISSILNKAGRRHDNPLRDVERPETKVRTRRLAIGEIGAVLKVLDERRGDLFADFVSLALLTGARRGSLCAMRWDDLHLSDGIWLVPAVWSKNRREVAVALPSRAVEILGAREKGRSGSAWVWPSARSATGHVVNPEKPLSEILKAAGVSRVTMHDLRRTLGTRLAMTGAGAATISAALGHISPQSAKAYVHIDVAHARAAMEKAIDAP